jgi:hypothetical protein
MLEHVFLWCRDRRIYGPSRKELERLIRSQRQSYLDTWLTGVSHRLSPAAITLLETSLAEPDSPAGFNTMKEDAGRAGRVSKVVEILWRGPPSRMICA